MRLRRSRALTCVKPACVDPAMMGKRRTEDPVYKHILIPTDGSELSDKAINAAIDYARETGARVTGFIAMPEYQVPSEAELMARRAISPEQHARNSQQLAEKSLGRIAERARFTGIEFDTDYVLSDRPYEAIIEAARRHGCDAIFMASHGRKALSRLLHGSQTVKVLTHSDIPTLVVR
jgi:nucleotide-binding universal stress UspA family protein